MILSVLVGFEIWTRRLAANDADILEILDGLSISIIDVNRHFQSTVLKHPGQSTIKQEEEYQVRHTHFQVNRR